MDSLRDIVEKRTSEMERRLHVLKTCIDKLNDVDKRILKLRYYRGFTLETIGMQISKSKQAAFYSLSRIHLLLTQCIKRTLNSEMR